jgi:hypothetical protein
VTLGYSPLVKNRRKPAGHGELPRSPGSSYLRILVPAVTASALMVAACGSSGSATSQATQDATAACQALVRSRAELSSLSLSVGYRLTGATNLALAAAGEDSSRYGNLSSRMKALQNDVASNSSQAIAPDVAAALSVCNSDKLPSK